VADNVVRRDMVTDASFIRQLQSVEGLLTQIDGHIVEAKPLFDQVISALQSIDGKATTTNDLLLRILEKPTYTVAQLAALLTAVETTATNTDLTSAIDQALQQLVTIAGDIKTSTTLIESLTQNTNDLLTQVKIDTDATSDALTNTSSTYLQYILSLANHMAEVDTAVTLTAKALTDDTAPYFSNVAAMARDLNDIDTNFVGLVDATIFYVGTDAMFRVGIYTPSMDDCTAGLRPPSDGSHTGPPSDFDLLDYPKSPTPDNRAP